METKTAKKMKVAVIYGGRSGEHEVSLRSAASVIRALDKDKFDVLPVAITKSGKWLLADGLVKLALAENKASLPIPDESDETLALMLSLYPRKQGGGELLFVSSRREPLQFDVIFPVMHGPMCEDGTIQGAFELAEVPYVGCGVLASSAGMDKEISKRLARDAGILIVPYVAVRDGQWRSHSAAVKAQVSKELKYPVFVKPANMGSSVGVHRVKTAAELDAALDDAFRYDTKVLVEKAVTAREIELAVLENADDPTHPLVSVPGEVAPTHEFYSYEAKYLDENGAGLMIPAELTSEQVDRARKMAAKVFTALEGEGLARCDLFLDKVTGELYFNEVNTLPGFTSISMYPKMWEASGTPYRELLTQLIQLAFARCEKKRRLVRQMP